MQDIRNGLKVAPFNSKLRLQLVNNLYRMKNWSETLPAADAALEVAPNDFNAQTARTHALAELGRAADARTALDKMQKDFPNRAKEIDTLRRALAEKLKG